MFLFINLLINNIIKICKVDHLKRLTREMITIKYDMRQALSLLDVLVRETTERTPKNTDTDIFKDIEYLFPLQTNIQLNEVEEILTQDSQHANIIVSCICINTQSLTKYVKS